MSTLDHLRATLPPVDLIFVQREAPSAMTAAKRYRDARSALSLHDLERTSAVAVRAKEQLLAAIERGANLVESARPTNSAPP